MNDKKNKKGLIGNLPVLILVTLSIAVLTIAFIALYGTFGKIWEKNSEIQFYNQENLGIKNLDTYLQNDFKKIVSFRTEGNGLEVLSGVNKNANP